jgi:hypothetical protein
MLTQVVGAFKRLVCSVEIARIAKEVEGTKIGGHFSFNFNTSKAASQTRFVPEQNSIADAALSFCVGSRCWNVQEASWFG